MNALSIILIILGSIIGFVAFIIGIWYLVRILFKFIFAPWVDGSYIYDKADFQADGKTPLAKKLTEQKNDYEFNFDINTLHYSVRFGNKRALKYGVTRLHHKGIVYSSHPHESEKKLLLQERNEVNVGHVRFQKLRAESKAISIEWILEDTSIRVITHFSLFKDGKLSIKEPDLKYTSTELSDLNFIVFSVEFPDGLNETSTSDFNNPCIQFPRFFNDSPNRRILSYKNRKFSPATQQIIPTSGPVTLFDEDANTIVISSMDQFVTHVTKVKGSKLRVSQFQCGLNGEIKEIPAKHESHYIIMFDKGINDSLFRLGDILRSYHKKQRRSMSMDNFTTYLGYWTDNGARYYYKPMKNASMSETLIMVDKYAEQTGIPINNYNLDSWWYRKDVKKGVRALLGPIGRVVGGGLYGGTIEWDIDPEMMHHTMKELKKQINNKAINAHGRWFSKNTVYKDDYPFITEGTKSLCIEPEFWEMIMKQCKEYGIDNYEQDWMDVQFNSFNFLRNTVGTTKKWLTSMGDAAKKFDRTIEYCMSMSGMFLSSIYVEPVSFIRSCDDYNPQWPRNWDYKHFVQTNILAFTVRAWPFKDVFMSKKSGILTRERQPELMALASALSCGPVGPGDRIDEFGIDNLFKTCRMDGYLIKPDRPLTATDLMFVPNAKYFLATTYSDHENLRWWYVIQSKLDSAQPKDPLLHPKDFEADANTEYVAYNYFRDRLRRFSSLRPIESQLSGQDYKYLIIAPVLKEGFALIGDITKFATMSYQTFEKVEWEKNELHLTLKSIIGEPLHLMFYDDDKIKSIKVDGKALKKNSLQWVIDSTRNSSLVLHEFTSNTCEIIVKVKK